MLSANLSYIIDYLTFLCALGIDCQSNYPQVLLQYLPLYKTEPSGNNYFDLFFFLCLKMCRFDDAIN